MQKKIYYSTSIFYTNGDPHLGHALELVQADFAKRAAILYGNSVFLNTGTDEYGQKALALAEKQGLDFKDIIKDSRTKIKKLNLALGISYDSFISTSISSEHHKSAQKIWKTCLENDDIYFGKYSGLYCNGCEQYYLPKELVNNFCPEHQVELSLLETESYFFRLSKYQQQIYDIIDQDIVRIFPKERKEEVLGFIRSGLEDFSTSRPLSQLSWGVPVPDDSKHVMYVWFDALSNYLTVANYAEELDSNLWPLDIHFIGKSILRFHAIYWIGMLLSSKLELPKQIVVHGILKSNGQKMSKSLGNNISPFSIIDQFGRDVLRLFFIKAVSSGNDANFDLEHLKTVLNSDLANSYGNLISRILTLLAKLNIKSINHETLDLNTALAKDLLNYLKNFRYELYAGELFTKIYRLNAELDKQAPWKKLHDPKTETWLREKAREILEINQFLSPILIDTTAKVESLFNNIELQNPILFEKQ